MSKWSNVSGSSSQNLHSSDTSSGYKRDKKLDIFFTNVTAEKTAAHVGRPLETEDGSRSDHSSVILSLACEIKRRFEWKKIRVRKRSKKGDLLFGELVKSVDWDVFFESCRDVSEMVERYQQLTESWMEECYPYKTRRIRSNENPWITNRIRKLIRMRMAVFKREGRSLSLIHI